MARQTRIQAAGLIHHLMSRGNDKMSIFLDDVDYRRFIFLLGEVLEASAIDCWNYCVMPNHYHATVQPTQPNLSQAVQKLNSVYGQWWNRRHRRLGHVFQGRFKAQIVDRDAYLIALSRYVVMNPVRAGLVERPEDWAWSSYRATAGLEPAPTFLATRLTLGLFGDGTDATLTARFARLATPDRDDSMMADRIRSNERVLGAKAFKALVAESDGVV